MSQRRSRLSFHGINVEVEFLETRTVPSATAELGAAHVAEVNSAPHNSPRVQGAASVETETHLAGPLTSNDPKVTATGSVAFESATHGTTTSSEFHVKVTGLAAVTTYDVTVVNGIDKFVVGTIKTDATGTGQLELETGSTSHPLPLNFPVISAASTVTVGTNLSAKLAALTPPTGAGGQTSEPHTETHLQAALNDPKSTTAISGRAEFESETEHGSVVSVLKVSVKKAPPGAKLDVMIGSFKAGTITVDASGNGSLLLSPVSADFPALNTTSPITLLNGTATLASGTFATSH